ncbi:MAG: hypothetical protein IKN55_12575, partial [Oscillospiraceae bacterium]|nr:hypothetical protein [Oscillospiraceae bacterium]
MLHIHNKLMSEDLFLILYGCWLFIAVVAISSMFLYVVPWIPFSLLRYACIFGMLLIKAYTLRSFSTKEFLILVISTLVVASLLYFWGPITAESLLIVMLAYKMDFNRIAKVTIAVVLLALLLIIGSSLAGIIQNYNYRTYNDTRDRFGLGFRYATYPTHYILLVVMLVSYVKREMIGLKEIVPLVLLNLYVYSQSHSRNSMMLSLGILLCSVLFKHTKFHIPDNWFTRISVAGIFVYLTVIQFILAIVYDPRVKWMAKLNKLMSERLRLNAHAYQTYKLTLLGQVTNFEAKAWQNGVFKRVGMQYTGMDSSYLGILYRNGILSLALFLVIFTVAGIYALKHRDRYLTVILVVLAAHSAFDPQLNLLQYNTFLILAFSITVGTYREKFSEKYGRVLGIGKKQNRK